MKLALSEMDCLAWIRSDRLSSRGTCIYATVAFVLLVRRRQNESMKKTVSLVLSQLAALRGFVVGLRRSTRPVTAPVLVVLVSSGRLKKNSFRVVCGRDRGGTLEVVQVLFCQRRSDLV